MPINQDLFIYRIYPVKDAARNMTNRASRICQHLSNSWENWLSNWNWMPCVLPFLGPLLLTLILTFGPCLMHLFFFFPKFQDRLHAFTNWTIHELFLTHSDYQKLQPHNKSPWPTFQPFLISPPWHTCPQGSSYRRLTFGPYPKSKRLAWSGPHGVSLIRWLIM